LRLDDDRQFVEILFVVTPASLPHGKIPSTLYF
jgi:hypothetical protein